VRGSFGLTNYQRDVTNGGAHWNLRATEKHPCL
jgi:hypothetical protein